MIKLKDLLTEGKWSMKGKYLNMPSGETSSIPGNYDRDAIKYTQTDALDMIQRTYGQDPTLVRKLQNSIKLLVAKTDDPNTAVKEKTDISDTALTAVIIADTVDFDLFGGGQDHISFDVGAGNTASDDAMIDLS